jgi:hypothetical protein
MKTNRIVRTILVGILIVFFFTSGWASGGGRTVVLEPMPEHPEATGNVLIDKNHISVQARGLKPGAVYTVWFVNMKPKKSEAGAGEAPYMFKTDPWGNGNYSAPLNESPFGKWSMIMVVLHPNDNPKDMKNMVGALKAPM